MRSAPPKPSTLIAIAGGSGSGKSTLADALAAHLSDAAVLSEDDYYRCAKTIPDFDPSAYDFDGLAAKDMALLGAHLTALAQMQRIHRPIYDFTSHTRATHTAPFGPARFIILEGIHALSDPQIAAMADLRVLMDAPDDVRLARRLLRDVCERGRTPQTVIAQYFATVRPNHYAMLAMHRARADLILDVDQHTDITSLTGAVIAALETRHLV